jgi:hypothetical protein
MLSFKLFRVLEAHDPREGERDRDYHPVIKYNGKDYHADRPRTHYEILRHIYHIHNLSSMSDLDKAHDEHRLYFGLKHKKTGKITWGNF